MAFNSLGVDTHAHTNFPDKNNFKKPEDMILTVRNVIFNGERSQEDKAEKVANCVGDS